MSEAVLYAIDASHVKDADAAAQFVEQSEHSKDAPTTRIATFFVHLLQTWPEDGSKGHMWHEDFAHNRPAGSMLAMTFELSELDAERMHQLRAIAKHNGLHIFDPEGYVLYLADGSEAGSPGMTAPQPGAPVQCTFGVRFDGVYEARTKEYWNYLCFNADGKIFWYYNKGRSTARSVTDTLLAGVSFVIKGNYKPGVNGFTARLSADFGSYKMNGRLKEDGLHVHSERTNGKYPYDSVYEFLPL